ncbi:MAG: response regulator [Granulosicoccus sp.]
MHSIDQNQEDIEQALHRVLFKHALLAWSINMLAGLMCAGFLYEKVDFQSLSYWTCSMMLLGLMRLPVVLKTREGAEAHLHVSRYTTIVGLNAIGWSTMAFFWSPELPLTMQLFILVAPYAVCAANIFSFGAGLWTFRIYVLCMLVPNTIILILLSDGSFLPHVGPLVLFTFAILSVAKQIHTYLAETIDLRLRNQALVSDLSLQNESFREARDDAQKALVVKEEFLARMSHELRTPMNGVLGMSRRLAKMELNPEQKQAVSTLQRSGEAMLSMVSDLLDASSMATGTVRLESEPYNIRETIELLIAQYTSSLAERPVDIRLKIDHTMPVFIMGDRQRVSQMIAKLVDNAIKFTAAGEVVIRVSADNMSPAELGSKSKGNLVVTVSDTGAGIERSELSKVRELFHQVEGSSSRRYGGSGLGLALVQGLTDLMGGRFELDSQIGVGTQATLVIPMLEAESPEQLPANNVTSLRAINAKSVTAESSKVSMRALVAEDNPINQLVIENMLEDLNCDVTVAENGIKAVELLKAERFDIVFMDCQMPVMDGYEATRIARENGHTLPIVAVTANTLAGDRTLCMDAGMNDYLPKPITDEMLAMMLNKWLGSEPSKLAC